MSELLVNFAAMHQEDIEQSRKIKILVLHVVSARKIATIEGA